MDNEQLKPVHQFAVTGDEFSKGRTTAHFNNDDGTRTEITVDGMMQIIRLHPPEFLAFTMTPAFRTQLEAHADCKPETHIVDAPYRPPYAAEVIVLPNQPQPCLRWTDKVQFENYVAIMQSDFKPE